MQKWFKSSGPSDVSAGNAELNARSDADKNHQADERCSNIAGCPTAVLSGKVAGPTRLELATSGVTGRRSNQLNYDPTSSKAPNDSALLFAVQGPLAKGRCADCGITQPIAANSEGNLYS